MKRFRQLALRGVGILGVAASLLWLAQVLVLPLIVRHEAIAALAKLGLANARCEVVSASLWGTTLDDLQTDNFGDARIDTVELRYSPWSLLSGKLKSIRLTGASLTINPDSFRAASKSDEQSSEKPGDLPFDRLEIRSSTVRLKWRGREWALPVDASLVPTSQDANRVHLATAVHDSRIEIDVNMGPKWDPQKITARSDRLDPSALAASLPEGFVPAGLHVSGVVSFAVSYVKPLAGGSPHVALNLESGKVVVNDREFQWEKFDADAGIESSVDANGTIWRLSPDSTVAFGSLSGPNLKATNGVLNVEGEIFRRNMSVLDDVISTLPPDAIGCIAPRTLGRITIVSREPVAVDAGKVAVRLGRASLDGQVAVGTRGVISSNGRIRFDSTHVHNDAARLDLDDCSGELPISWNALPTSGGMLSIGDVTINGKKRAPFTGVASLIDGVLAVDGSWRVANGATLFPAAEGIEVTGNFGLHARMNLSATGQAPNIQLTAADGKIVAKQWDAEFSGIETGVAVEAFSPLSTPPSQHITVKSAKIGKLQLSDGSIQFRVENPNSIFVEQTDWGWAGGRLYGSAFRMNPSDPNIELVVSGDKLELNQVLSILTSGRATGEGTLYGRLPVKIHWPHLAFGDGFLYATPGAGRLTMGDSVGIVGNLMDQSDSRFKQDQTMQQVKSLMLESLRDFDYKLLKVDFKNDASGLHASVQAQGKGRAKPNLPEIVPTLNVNGLDQVLNNALVIKKSFSSVGQ